MWTFYRPNDEQLITLADLKTKLDNGELVAVPNDQKFGFLLDLKGAHGIAEKDRANQKYYLATKRETAGCLLYIAQELQRLRQRHSPLIPVVSAVSRTVEYQKELAKTKQGGDKSRFFSRFGHGFRHYPSRFK